MSIRKKLFIAVVSLSLVIASITGYRYATGTIDAYNATSDKNFILDVFQKNWYWLVSEYSTDFSPEFMLDTRSSSRNAHDRGNLTIKVYHKQSVPVGFIAYYVKTAYQGFILFLAVDEQYRSRGYARQLMEYAFQDLKTRGCLKVRLVTRVSNIKGQRVYTGLGFKEIERYKGFIIYEKTLA